MSGLATGPAVFFVGSEPASGTGLNAAGLSILIVAVVGIVTMVVWCYSSILRRPPDPME